jgi:hypothetical protein
MAIDFLCRTSLDKCAESQFYRRYEASLWVDGLTNDTLEEFCTVLQTAQELPVPVFVQIAKCWRASSLPSYVPDSRPSALVLCAIQQLPSASSYFAFLTCRVVAACLLSELRPLSLALVIVDVASTVGESKNGFIYGTLLKYAESMVQREFDLTSNAEAVISKYMGNNSAPKSLLREKLARSNGKMLETDFEDEVARDLMVLALQATHLAVISQGRPRERFVQTLHLLFPVVMMVSAISGALHALNFT